MFKITIKFAKDLINVIDGKETDTKKILMFFLIAVACFASFGHHGF